MAISSWSTTPSSNNMATPNGAPEGMTPASVNDVIRQHMADHRTQWEAAQWFDYGHTPTKVDSDTFTVSGDQTAIYDAGRRIKFTGSVSGYATISSSSYSAPNTTVNVSTSSFTGTLTAVAVGILSGSNNAAPITSGSFTGTLTGVSGTVTGTINYIVNDGVVTLWAASSITGTSTSTSFTMTGLPVSIRPSGVGNNSAIFALLDNTAGAMCGCTISGGTIIFAKWTSVSANSSSGFTASGTKGIGQGWTYVYSLTS